MLRLLQGSRFVFQLLFLSIFFVCSPGFSAEKELTTVCHIPPGNRDNPQLIEINSSALNAHLKHGDRLNNCVPELDPDLSITLNRSSGVTGTVFELQARQISEQPNSAFEYIWTISDGRSFQGEFLNIAFSASGYYIVQLEAVLADSIVESTTTAIVIHERGEFSPVELGLAEKPGDLDNDGFLSLEDALGAAQFAGRLKSLNSAEQTVIDFDISGEVTFEDVILISESILGANDFPDRLLASNGASGSVITLASHNLLNPENLIQIQVGSGDLQTPPRPVMGFATFVIPFDVSAGETQIKLYSDSLEIAQYSFTVLPPPDLPSNPVEEVKNLLGNIFTLLEVNDSLVSQQLENYQISDQTRLVLSSIGAGGKLEADASLTNLVEQLDGSYGEFLATAFLHAAYANGLSDFQVELDRFLSNYTDDPASNDFVFTSLAASAFSPNAVCDELLPALCALKASSSLLKSTSKVVSTSCDILMATGLGLFFIPVDGPVGESAALATWATVCAPLEFAIDAAGVMTDLISDIDADLRISANKYSPQAGEAALITAALDVFGIDDVCQLAGTAGSGRVVARLSKQLVGRMIERKITVRGMERVFTALGEDFLQHFLGLLEKAAGQAIATTGIEKAILEFAQPFCEDIYGAELVIDSSRVLEGPQPNEGTLRFLSNGKAEYFCPVMSTNSNPFTAAFTATKDICREQEQKRINILCDTRDVTITMGDNGNLNDDIYEVRVDGVTILTTSFPARSASVTFQLPIGAIAEVEMLGRAAPDGVGTYFISFNGAQVISGDSLSGRDLVPGAVKNFVIQVAL